MSILTKFRRLLNEPPPLYAVEISHGGVAWWRRARKGAETGYHPLEPGSLTINPLRDNVVRPDELLECARKLAAQNGRNKRRTAALILPDYSTRVAVLDFDSLPSGREEQLALVRYRMKKSIPFDVESAHVSFYAQPSGGGRKYEVVAAICALEIVARYEAAFRSAGFEPGFVTTSTLAALNLVPEDGVTVLAKLSGSVLTAAVVQDRNLRLLRCLELPEVAPDEVNRVLYPTFAFCEDTYGARPERMLLCGFDEMGGIVGQQARRDFGVEVDRLRSKRGEPGAANAGLVGYLEAAGE